MHRFKIDIEICGRFLPEAIAARLGINGDRLDGVDAKCQLSSGHRPLDQHLQILRPLCLHLIHHILATETLPRRVGEDQAQAQQNDRDAQTHAGQQRIEPP